MAFWFALWAATLPGISSAITWWMRSGVLAVDVPRLVVERLDDVAQPVQRRLGLAPVAACGHGTGLASLRQPKTLFQASVFAFLQK
jgi:hypothetical protein